MTRNIKKYINPFLKAKRPLKAAPISARPNIKEAIALQKQGKLCQAADLYRLILDIDPDNADALHLLGVIAHQHGNYQSAIDLISKAIEINPNAASFHCHRGVALQELRQLESSLASYDKALELKPDYAQAYFNRGSVLNKLQQLDAAVASFNNAIELQPHYADAYYNRANALLALRQLDASVASYNTAIELKPDFAEAYYNRANALQALRQLDASVASYNTAIELKPDFAEAYTNRGTVLKDLKQLDASLADYEKAIALKPDFVDAYYNRGIALQELRQFDASLADFDKAMSLKPYYEYLFGIRLHAKMLVCDWRNFEGNVLSLSKSISNNEKASTCFPTIALPISLHQQRKAAEVWVADKYPSKSFLGAIHKFTKTSKIRIGYYSADFHNHATTYLMAELFELHNKDKFELTAFSFGPNKNDEMRNRVTQAFDRFVDVSNISDQSVAELSRKLGIDIAIDLKGLTKDARLGIFSYRAAPIQVSYLGYPGTLGANYIDYLIADKLLVPQESQEYYTEKIVYLPHSYQVNDRQRVVSQKPITKQDMGLPKEGFVFCSFNNNFKITPAIFDTWVRILKAADSSVLWLLEDNETAMSNLRQEAHLRGLDPNRLVFAKRMSFPEHMARHKAADLFLDTLPYNAHTTASDALWSGLPVLTCMGESFASRVAASLLNAIGLPELVTTTQNEYELLAIELASTPEKLKAIKDKLERNRLVTPLFDTPRFTKIIETAYTKMYERYQVDLPPEHIYIT